MIKHSYLAMQPIYPLLVQQFIDDYDLSDGVACDIGTGPGFLGLELAKASNMKIIFLDWMEICIRCRCSWMKCLIRDGR